MTGETHRLTWYNGCRRIPSSLIKQVLPHSHLARQPQSHITQPHTHTHSLSHTDTDCRQTSSIQGETIRGICFVQLPSQLCSLPAPLISCCCFCSFWSPCSALQTHVRTFSLSGAAAQLSRGQKVASHLFRILSLSRTPQPDTHSRSRVSRSLCLSPSPFPCYRTLARTHTPTHAARQT